MKGTDLRKWHRSFGITLATFIILQVGTGIWLTLGQKVSIDGHEHGDLGNHAKNSNDIKRSGSDVHDGKLHHGMDRGIGKLNDMIMTIHHGGGLTGTSYRILLGTGILLQTVLGTLIFLGARSRTKKPE